jgi:flavin-dependent dehydrogenase
MDKKIIIIGAGPIGCYLGQSLKLYGFDPVIVEEHAEVGRPVHCTGLVGSKLFSEPSQVPLPRDSIINTINGSNVNYNDLSFTIRRKDVAYVVDREKFDKGLSKGLNILYNNKFLGFEKNNGHYVVETDKGELFADIIIAADGANSSMRRLLGQDGEVTYYKGLQFRMVVDSLQEDLVDVYLHKPDFFWVVPEGKNIARVGVISENPHKDLQDFLGKGKLHGKIIEKFGGLVTLGVCNSTVKDNIALVGGAACQLKPLSYGGVYFGIKAAAILAECIKNDRLKEYDYLWKKELASEISMGLKLKDIYARLSDEDLVLILGLLKKEKSLIEEKADFENHSRFILDIIKSPELYPRMGDLLRILFKVIL